MASQEAEVLSNILTGLFIIENLTVGFRRRGICKYSDGEIYDGELKNGNLEGSGMESILTVKCKLRI